MTWLVAREKFIKGSHCCLLVQREQEDLETDIRADQRHTLGMQHELAVSSHL